MSEVTKPILLDETGQSIVTKLDDIKNAILSQVPAGDPVRITVVTPPTKTNYSIGENINLSGIAVSAIFSNNALIDITDQCTYSPDSGELALGDAITVSWLWRPTEQTFTTSTPITVSVPTFSAASKDQIETLLELHYNGDIDIHDYWSVGDEKSVCIYGALEDGDDADKERYDSTFVLLNAGGKTLVTPIHGETECAFIVGFKELIWNSPTGNWNQTHAVKSKYDATGGSDGSFNGGWETSDIRDYLNTTFKNTEKVSNDTAEEDFNSLFKQFYNVTGSTPGGSATTTTSDYWAVPAIKEVTGSTTTDSSFEVNAQSEATLSQFDYYKTSSNRLKTVPAEDVSTDSPSDHNWYLRSTAIADSYKGCLFVGGKDNTSVEGQVIGADPITPMALNPFSVI